MKKKKLLMTKYRDKYMALLMDDMRHPCAIEVTPMEGSRLGAVYIGKIRNIAQNIGACFVEIEGGELCYLSLEDCHSPILISRACTGKLREGDELVVQVIKDPVKTKQAAVTADISLAGRWMVLTLGSKKLGISSRLSDKRKKRIKELLRERGILRENTLLPPKHFEEHSFPLPSFGLVIRTEAGEKAPQMGELLEEEYISLWEELSYIIKAARTRTCFSCLRQPSMPYESLLSRFYAEEYEEIVTDLSDELEEMRSYLKKCGLEDIPLRLYTDPTYSLASLYSLETRIKEALSPRVWLKSGGYLVIEPTEALTVIDVNTGKYEAGKDAEDTIWSINKEAASEIARQLRLRNLSGIILVDFINMKTQERQEELLELLRQLVRTDRIKTCVIDITALGLVEITRKKIHKSLREQLNAL